MRSTLKGKKWQNQNLKNKDAVAINFDKVLWATKPIKNSRNEWQIEICFDGGIRLTAIYATQALADADFASLKA